jgi:hypothetical protein
LRKAAIKIEDQVAGWLTQDELGYQFVYDKTYAATPKRSDQTDHIFLFNFIGFFSLAMASNSYRNF